MDIYLKLKLLSDAGLIGLPNVGKSTFLSRTTAAKPKIANYQFTTLKPSLGVVYVSGEEFVLADIPGLIEGAHTGKGLGDKFLKHIERCGVLIHVIDANSPHVDKDYLTIRNELESRVQSFNLILDDVAITNLTFGKEFASAIEKKQVAEQEAERQKYLVEKADQEKKAAVIIAEGEAEAATMMV